MNKTLLTTAIVFTSICASTAFSDEQKKKREKLNPWLDCGIGAIVFPDDDHEIGAGISNITFDLGTTATSSATSSPGQCKGSGNVEIALFIQRTYPTLEAELAKGRGENLMALAKLVKTSQEDQFIAILRNEMAEKYAKEDLGTLDDQAKMQALYFSALEISERVG